MFLRQQNVCGILIPFVTKKKSYVNSSPKLAQYD